MTAKPPAKVPTQSLAARARRDPGLLKKALANPGLRSKLPSSMLTTAQRRSRQKIQTTAALGDVTTPLSGKNLTDIASQVVNGAYDPQMAGIDRQSATTTAQGEHALAGTRSIYDQIGKFAASQAAAQQAAGAAGATAVQGITQNALGQVDKATAQEQAQAAQDAAVRGPGLDGGANAALDARTAQARAGIAAAGQTAATQQGSNAAAINAVMAGLGVASQQQGGEQQGNIRTATKGTLDDLAAKRSQLAGQKGGALADEILKLRQQGSDEYYTAGALNLNTAKAQSDALAAAAGLKQRGAAQSASEKLALRRDATSRRGQDLSHTDRQASIKAAAEKAAAKAAEKKKGKSPYVSTAGQSSAKDKIDSAVTTAKNLKDSYSEAELRKLLLTGRPAQTITDPKTGQKVKPPAIPKIDKAWLNVAMDIIYKGYISAANIKALHARGIKVNGLGYPTKPNSSVATEGAAQAVAGLAGGNIFPKAG